eukprot:7548775-Karenia_brevis.AAC.1
MCIRDRGRIGDVEQKAEQLLAEQKLKFEIAAKQYERDARDVTEVEMMPEKVSSSQVRQPLIDAE